MTKAFNLKQNSVTDSQAVGQLLDHNAPLDMRLAIHPLNSFDVTYTANFRFFKIKFRLNS